MVAPIIKLEDMEREEDYMESCIECLTANQKTHLALFASNLNNRLYDVFVYMTCLLFTSNQFRIGPQLIRFPVMVESRPT